MDEIKPTLPLRVVVPVLMVYFILSALGLRFHELGLEEGQQYLFGRDSASLADLYHNMRYEGHPRLWCILLYGIIHYVTADFAAIQVFHLLITTATVYIFLRYAPFDRLIKIGLVFGYYFIFEYNLQSRSYALGILLLFITCLLLNRPVKYLPFIGFLLLMMCNTDIFYAFAAVGIYLYLLMDYAAQRRLLTTPFYLLTAFFLAGLACSLIQAQIPHEDYIVNTSPEKWLSGKNLSMACLTLAGGWLPVPQQRAHFWNTFLVNAGGVGVVARVVLSIFLLLLPGALLKNNPRALVFYYCSLFLLLALLIVTTFSAARYFGMVVIYFLAAWWIAGNGTNEGIPAPALLLAAFRGLVLVQLAVGLFALEQDLTRPFSQAKNAVAWLKDHRLNDQVMVVNGYIAGPALSTYLGKKVWYLNTGGEGSFCYWRRPYFPIPPKTLTEEITGSPFLPHLDTFILLSSTEIDQHLLQAGPGGFRFNPLRNFRDGILSTEDCYIYQAIRTVNH